MKKIKTLDVIVFSALIAVVAYTVTVLIFSWHDKVVPDSLTVAFMGVMGTELGATVVVYKAKSKVKQEAIEDKIDLMKENGITPDKDDFKAETEYQGYSDYYEESGGNVYG